jgi:hypothetical protein
MSHFSFARTIAASVVLSLSPLPSSALVNADPSPSPEVVAAEAVRKLNPQGKLAFDPRVVSGWRSIERTAPRHDSSVVGAATKALGGRAAQLDEVMTCSPDKRRCRFLDATVVIATSRAQIRGEAATVEVRAVIERIPDRPKGIYQVDYEVVLRRGPSGWVVDRTVVTGQS